MLIIEDDPSVVDLVSLYLARDGHEVLTAHDGAQGLRRALEEAPDLIVLDLMLPLLDGQEVCRRVRQESNVPIVMLTARVEEEDRLTGLETAADDYVTKPFGRGARGPHLGRERTGRGQHVRIRAACGGYASSASVGAPASRSALWLLRSACCFLSARRPPADCACHGRARARNG